ncbi:putative beta-glucosidase G [Fulvia fulva]|nr:putative beta-glucosidase G [Fulvia fulva]WPV18254.1 putative beta-glucosidase G [Fulvia fulva]
MLPRPRPCRLSTLNMVAKALTYLGLLAQVASAATWKNHADFLHSPGPEEIPSPLATGAGWEDAFVKATDFISRLTLEEKVALVSGTEGPCVGNIAPINRLNFTGLCIQNGPLALQQGTYSSVFGAGLTVATSWHRDGAYTRGHQLAEEFRGKGSQVILGPVAGPLGRHANGGRNWERFSPDPYLTGELFSETIVGMQDGGVQACAKHYIGNEQETQRQPSTVNGTTIESVSANIDDRTMHELYLWPFAQAVKAGVASVMCSYNRLNQTYACQNSKAQNDILKGELGFQGYVMSDWDATHSGALAVNAGEDMEMPGTASSGDAFFHQNLTNSVNNGSVSTDRIDDMAKRILTPYFHLKQDQDFPGTDPASVATNAILFSNPGSYEYNYTFGDEANIDVRADHGESIREAGAAGTVLLKNVNSTLPLKNPRHIGVFGNDAGDFTNGMSYFTFNGIGNYEYGTLATGGGSGSGLFTYVVSPLEAIKQRVGRKDKGLVQYVLNNTAIIQDTSSCNASSSCTPDAINANGSPYIVTLQPQPPEVCLVFVKSWATESEDRTSLDFDWQGDQVVETIASWCPNTIVVTHSGGVNVMPWADHPNITAILAAHLPGEESGNSIVDVLWGESEPSGRLPYTIAKKASDYDFAPITNSTALFQTTNPYAWQADFTEGTLTDYRHFDYYNTSVQYPFGYGLSYTTFSLASELTITPTSNATITATPPEAPTAPGGNPHLWETLYTIKATITNTGTRAGAAVPQLYLSLPGPRGGGIEPKNVLRGFEKVRLEVGESKVVEFALKRRDVSYWDVVTQQWTVADGEVVARVGWSSREFEVEGRFRLLE